MALPCTGAVWKSVALALRKTCRRLVTLLQIGSLDPFGIGGQSFALKFTNFLRFIKRQMHRGFIVMGQLAKGRTPSPSCRASWTRRTVSARAGVRVAPRRAHPGRVRALGVSTTKRNPQLPDVPALAESGVPGYEFTQWYALLAPAKTPADILATLHSTLLKSMDDAEVKKRVSVEGIDDFTATARLSAAVKNK